MSNAKLHIDVAQGIFEAEGSEDFVWKVYEDFRDNLQSNMAVPEPAAVQTPAGTKDAQSQAGGSVRKARVKRSASNKTAKDAVPGLSGYKPSIVDNLDTLGIKEFIAPYATTNHSNNIVAFLKFLESKGRKPATFDEVFTCYRDAGLKVPVAFGQAFIDTRGKKGFIEFTGANDVELTIRGVNHIDHRGMNRSDKA